MKTSIIFFGIFLVCLLHNGEFIDCDVTASGSVGCRSERQNDSAEILSLSPLFKIGEKSTSPTFLKQGSPQPPSLLEL